MLKNVQKLKENRGFTIIEVMIVLAIAGLIMLIVFLAVPALQRSAHNTSIKNDVSNILGAMNTYVNNNNGTMPTTASITGNVVTVSGGADTNDATGKVGYVSTISPTTLSSDVPSLPSVGTVAIVLDATCNAAGTQPQTGDNARQYVAFYQLEGGASECTAS